MIATARLLLRSSLVSVLFLVAALMTLVTVLTASPSETPEDEAGLPAALAALPPAHPAGGDPPAATRIALFDPERRAETVAGSIEDLRALVSPQTAPADLTLSGVLVNGGIRKAMLAQSGSVPAWSDVGAEIGGWRLASVDPGGAVLEHDGRNVVLRIADRFRTRAIAKSALDDAAPSAPPAADTPASITADALGVPDAVTPSKP